MPDGHTTLVSADMVRRAAAKVVTFDPDFDLTPITLAKLNDAGIYQSPFDHAALDVIKSKTQAVCRTVKTAADQNRSLLLVIV